MELVEALQDDDILVGAAFEIGEWSKDASHLVENLKGIAESRLDPGRASTEIVAQTELMSLARDVCGAAGWRELHGTESEGSQRFLLLADAIISMPNEAVRAYSLYEQDLEPVRALMRLLSAAEDKVIVLKFQI